MRSWTFEVHCLRSLLSIDTWPHCKSIVPVRLKVQHPDVCPSDERLPQSLRLADIEQASASVSELLYRPYPEEVAGSDSPSLATLSPIGTLSLATVGVEDLSLNTIYGRLMSCWLRPFTHRAPPRNRISLEHLIRRIAAAVLLSGITVENVGADIQAPENGGAREGLPSRTPPSQVPTPTPTPATDDNLPLLTLRRHTNFEASAQTLSGPVTKILDHWDPAIDPSDYDYARKTAQTGEEDAGQMSQEDKQREQRRAESKRRREESSQRKRAIKEPATSGAQSQPQAAMPPWSSPPSASTQTAGMSQPLAGPFVQASQPILSSQAPTTAGQVQPGKFGGKLPFRGRRKAGF